MSADTFVSALFIITAVVAAGILINAVYPIVWSTASTFSSSAHETDTRIRTDFQIVATYAKAGIPSEGHIYMKNIGTNPISTGELANGDVFFGKSSEFTRLAYTPTTLTTNGQWNYTFDPSYDTNNNNMWDIGETLHIVAYANTFSPGDPLHFQFVLPNGVWRSQDFTASTN